jgi:PEP-CTERM motif
MPTNAHGHRATHRHTAIAAALAALLLPLAAPVAASTFGSLANFDVVNDTGHTAYGFEIEIEDSAYDHAGTISSVFGYDRDFGLPGGPGAVVRYGKPTIEFITGFGARITYGGFVGPNATPTGPFATNGESCWPGANQNWKSTSCDHFGVSTYNSPAKTTYRWIVDIGGGTLAKQVVGVPAINIVYTPPVANEPPPAPPVIQLQAQDLGRGINVVEQNKNNAFWVKIIKTELDDNVDLGDLLGGNHAGARPEIAAMDGETEVEWQPLQLGMVDEVTKSLDSPKPSVVYKFQFFNYIGAYDDDGLVDPQSGKIDGEENQMPSLDDNGQAFVTIGGERQYLNFIGQQIAGFNAVEVPAVPEPGTWALMLSGLAAVGALARRRR